MHVDWSFADAPDGTGGADGGPPPAPLPNRPPRRPLPWRLILALAGAAVVAALGAWLFTRLGWLRLQSQLATQVAYEDKRALAGDVNAVLAVQAAGQLAWRDQLAAYVRLGLAAPLPAGDLRPAGTPPRIARLDPLGGDLFAATVTRDYLDPSGQTVAFDLVQTYRNTGPGAWERLAPDLSPLAAISLFQGQRLSVTVPTADLPWLGPALLQADSLIVQACADWGEACAADHRMVAAFGAAQELANPVASAQEWPAGGGQWPDQNQRPAALPRIFFLSPTLPPYGLSTPLLAGRPHDAASENAFSRSIAVQLLGLFAGELTGLARGNNDYFLDALVARVEARHLGADASPQPIAPQDYVPLNMLWQVAGTGQVASGWRTDLAWRREAYNFLNVALAGVHLMPANDNALPDGKLLLNLRLRLAGGASLDDWLARGAARGLPDRWTAQTLAAFAARPVTDWSQYDGLLMACDDGVYQVRDGAPQRLLTFKPSVPYSVSSGSVSPNGRYLDFYVYSTIAPAAGFTDTTALASSRLFVVDTADGSNLLVFAAPAIVTLGWSAAGDLIYAVTDAQSDQSGALDALVLRSYNPANQTSQVLIPERVGSYGGLSLPFWSADHSALLVGLAGAVPSDHPETQWGLLTFGPTAQLRRLPMVGGSPALSPDGRQVAYVHFGNPAGPSGSTTTFDAGLDRIEVLDLANGAITSLAATNDLGLPQGIRHFWGPRWSADGKQLVWMAYTNLLGNYLLSAPSAGGAVRVWTSGGSGLYSGSFSPDGRYVLAGSQPDPRVPGQFWLFDQQAPGVPPPLISTADSTVWTPSGHQLVIAGPAGVSSLDPASGEWEWLGAWQNCQLRW